MASVISKKSGFYVQFYYEGKKYQTTTGARTQAAAEHFAEETEKLLEQVQKGRLHIPAGVHVRDFVATGGRAKKPEEEHEGLPVMDLLDRYLAASQGGGMEATTHYVFTIHKRHLERHLQKDLRCSGVNFDVLQGYVTSRVKEGARQGMPEGWKGKKREKVSVSTDTIRKELNTLRAAWNFGGTVDPRLTMRPWPGRGLKFPKRPETSPFRSVEEIEAEVSRHTEPLSEKELKGIWENAYLSPKEVEAFLDEALQGREVRDRTLFTLIAHTGCRRSEALRSEVRDVDLSRGTFTVRERKRSREKETTRVVPLTPRLKRTLEEHLKGVRNGKLFPDMGRDLAHRIFMWTVAETKRWKYLSGYHVFRHSFISALAAKGADQRVIDALVGHSTEEQRRRYTHLRPDVKEEAVRGLFG